MPPNRTGSLSVTEGQQRTLQDWIDKSISQGLAEARRRRTSVLHVATTKVDHGLPISVFDSSLEDAQLFVTKERSVLGLGVAKAVDLESPKSVGTKAWRSKLGLDTISGRGSDELLVIGGWGFSEENRHKHTETWRDFPVSRWVVPALTFASKDGEAILILAVCLSSRSNEVKILDRYHNLMNVLESSSPESDPGRPPSLKAVQSTPSKRGWVTLAERAVDSTTRGELKKVVISRGLSLAFREKIKPSRVVRRLISLNPDATVFAIKRRRSVFLGATPESLLSARNGELSVDCIAASSQRSDDAGADEAFGSGLLTDPKSSREHRMVVQAAVSALSPISSRIEVPSAPVLKKLRSIQHLYTPLKATLLHPDDIWVAAQALWPNPAIGGDPRDVATRWISRFENQDRGWYTGVVGVLSANRNDADLVVGIRSGLIRGNAAVVYAGCGIVQGSKPRDELEETRWKLRTMAAALEVEPQEDW